MKKKEIKYIEKKYIMTRGMGEMKERSVEKTITKCRW